ncbi:LacI family DNA-binding transcriptional regulator [uncultured Martelella sp.]|uniref:LacI family DNA-binding transcriptional regulator n=1 Tax=uncultured Martelella sp. TaxID=392331 RepID=UPI0029C9949B|nr:LacI family DNA-binding transcriptional regulator [uncultured Martelella sp.]
MSDVAKAADVSKTTVSLVLNHVLEARIPDATRAHVFRVARELGYVSLPSTFNRDGSRTSVIGVLINEISAAYPINLLEDLQTAAEARNSRIVIQMTGGTPERERAALVDFRNYGVKGVIYAMSFNAMVTPAIELDMFRHVFVNCQREDGRGHAIVGDSRSGGYAAARHLIERGCRRIATITGDPWQVDTRERLQGFETALAEVNLSPFAVDPGAWNYGHARELTGRWLCETRPPDAIFCHNDFMARGALSALPGSAITCPKDILIIGYDDREVAAWPSPTLSTITLPHAEMAELALEALSGDGEIESARRFVEGELIARESTQRHTPE